MHPRLAAKLGIARRRLDGGETRRGAITLRAMVVTTIRPDTIFIPYHWPGKKSANQSDGRGAGSDQQDPPVQGVRLPRAEGGGRARLRGGAGAAAIAMAKPDYLHFFIDPSRCIGCQACVQACTRVRHAPRRVDDPPRVRRSGRQRADGARRLHALRAADVRRGLPGRRDQAHRRRRRADRAQAALHRLRELRHGLPVRRARALCRPRRS